MSDVEMDEENIEEVEANLTNPDVVDKYKTAAKIVNSTLEFLIPLVQPGAVIGNLCAQGDAKIEEGASLVFRQGKLEKGIAFPTTISVNNVVAHFSPYTSEGNIAINEGDVVKIELGAHIDGWTAVGGHTVIATGNPQEPTTGKKADAICAAHYAGECALRLLRPGNKVSQITSTIGEVAKIFSCNPVEGTVSYSCKRFDMESEKYFLNKVPEDTHPEDFTVEVNEVYNINIVMSTGEGKPKEGEAKTTVYRRKLENNYSLKMKTSRSLYREINNKFPSLPFSLRYFDEKTSRMGIVECVNHDLFEPYPVTYEKDGEFVAQFKFTVLVLPGSIQKLTAAPLPYVSSAFSITDPKLTNILNMGLKRAKTNKKKKKKSKAAQAAPVDTPVSQ